MTFSGFFLAFSVAFAQTNALPFPDSTIFRQKDVIDLGRRVLHKTGHRNDDSGQAFISAVPAAGYALQTGWAAVISSSIGFYTSGANVHKDQKMSSLIASIAYSQYNQVILPLQADLWTKDNRQNIITDWRYLKYPSTTFGLGGRSDINDGYTINFNYIKLHQTALTRIAKDFYGGIGYYYDHFWNVTQVDPPVGVKTAFARYGLKPKYTASGVAFKLLYDNRANQINPLKGFFGNVIFRPNYKALGSDNNWSSLLVELRKYFRFPASSKNTLAFWSYNWFTTSGKPPYLLLPSTGWDDFYNTGRGYIQGRYRSNDMKYLEAEYRFRITNNGLLGGIVFANAQSFSRNIDNDLSIIAPGYGAGLRIKFNKFSGANLCIDYGFGLDGSKGISVNIGEVF